MLEPVMVEPSMGPKATLQMDYELLLSLIWEYLSFPLPLGMGRMARLIRPTG